MGKAKNRGRILYCQTCDARHSPPTGARCGLNLEGKEGSEVRNTSQSEAETSPPRRSSMPRGNQETSKQKRSVPSSDTYLILAKLAELKDETAAQRQADRAETWKALKAMADRLDAVDLLSEDEQPVRRPPAKKQASSVPNFNQTFAKPVRQHATSLFNAGVSSDTLQNSDDPIARLREDGASAAQAQLILNAAGVSLPEMEGTNMRSGFYRNVNDMKLFDVPWPNDFIYRSNGKKATFDTMSIPEFVVGYCHIVIARLPVMKETEIAIDHVGYLSDMMSDVEGGDWDLVRGSHRQVLHQAEQGQLIWENAAARDAFRAKTLQRSERAASSGKGSKPQPNNRGLNTGMPRGQSNRCVFSSHHQSNGHSWVHMCATCLRVTGQKNPHPDCECKRRFAHERANRGFNNAGKGPEA